MPSRDWDKIHRENIAWENGRVGLWSEAGLPRSEIFKPTKKPHNRQRPQSAQPESPLNTLDEEEDEFEAQHAQFDLPKPPARGGDSREGWTAAALRAVLIKWGVKGKALSDTVQDILRGENTIDSVLGMLILDACRKLNAHAKAFETLKIGDDLVVTKIVYAVPKPDNKKQAPLRRRLLQLGMTKDGFLIYRFNH